MHLIEKQAEIKAFIQENKSPCSIRTRDLRVGYPKQHLSRHRDRQIHVGLGI